MGAIIITDFYYISFSPFLCNFFPAGRLFALEACTEIARKLGESYAPLLPETIPFLAELMEDDNEDVEKAVHHSCREIGRATGEDLQKYF